MNRNDGQRNRILAASGEKKAELVLKNAGVVNVFTNEIDYVDVAIQDGVIVGLGSYEGEREEDLSGMFLCPGFIDGHIHLESSMVSPSEFEQAVLPHGTTAVITDPHEIANVAGACGIDYMLEQTRNLLLDVYFMLSSCVPSTGLDESGAVLEAKELLPYYNDERVLGLAELMNSYGTVKAADDILDKISGAKEHQGRIDGHAPGIAGNDLNAYVTAGVESDHECACAEEGMEKLKRGQWIMIREGTAARNLDALMPLIKEPLYQRCMFVTDDKHPGDLIRLGHMDYIIRKAVAHGANPFHAVRMASYHTAQYFGLRDRGAIAPGYRADIVVVSSLDNMDVKRVYKDGALVAEDGVCLSGTECPEVKTEEIRERVFHSFHLDEITEEQLKLDREGKYQRIIGLTPHELLTTELILPWNREAKVGLAAGVDLEQDVIKMAVFERHHGTGHVGLGFLHGYGLKKGAVATSVAHDSHNLIIAGTNDADMALAGNCVREMNGGLAVAADGKIIGKLPLPIAGLMSFEPVAEVEEKLQQLKNILKEYGISEEIDAFMTLAFTSLPVIPELRLNTYGVIDVNGQKIVEAVFE